MGMQKVVKGSPMYMMLLPASKLSKVAKQFVPPCGCSMVPGGYVRNPLITIFSDATLSKMFRNSGKESMFTFAWSVGNGTTGLSCQAGKYGPGVVSTTGPVGPIAKMRVGMREGPVELLAPVNCTFAISTEESLSAN